MSFIFYKYYYILHYCILYIISWFCSITMKHNLCMVLTIYSSGNYVVLSISWKKKWIMMMMEVEQTIKCTFNDPIWCDMIKLDVFKIRFVHPRWQLVRFFVHYMRILIPKVPQFEGELESSYIKAQISFQLWPSQFFLTFMLVTMTIYWHFKKSNNFVNLFI
jgi:hypothetical protein